MISTVQLSEICQIVQGGRHKLSGKHFVPDGYPAYGAGGLNGNLATFEFERPAVILSSIGARCGKCFYANGRWSSLANTQVILPDLNKANAKFLWYQLNDEKRWPRQGLAQPFIKPSDVKAHRVYLPPLTDQDRITAILDQAEALRAKRRQALAKLDTLTQSLFLEMFDDQSRNPNGWPSATLGDVADMVTGYPFRSGEYVSGGDLIRLCRGANVLPGRIDWSDLACWPLSKMDGLSKFNLRRGDIVIAMDRPWISGGFKIARVQPADCPSLLVQRVARLRGKNEVPNEFLFYLLKHPAFTRHCRPTETTVPHISPKDIRSFAFPFPPTELRRKFAKLVVATERLRIHQVGSLSKLVTLFSSLQHRAFKGEL